MHSESDPSTHLCQAEIIGVWNLSPFARGSLCDLIGHLNVLMWTVLNIWLAYSTCFSCIPMIMGLMLPFVVILQVDRGSSYVWVQWAV